MRFELAPARHACESGRGSLVREDSLPTVLELYEQLQPKLGEDEAQALIACVEASVERKAATQEDLRRTEAALTEDLQPHPHLCREVAPAHASLLPATTPAVSLPRP